MELDSDLKIAGMILVGGSENQPTPESQGLWRGTRPNQGLQLSALNVHQRNGFREWERHRQHPCSSGPSEIVLRNDPYQLSQIPRFV
jgi:hypothetical protein